ncbi:MAG: phage holin family protein [Phenylobacterium sp.]
MLGKLLVRAVFGALGLWIASKLVAGVSFASVEALIIAACVLGVVNAIVRPVVILLTLPLTIITLGLFLLIVNAAMIGLTSMVVPGFHVAGLIPGVLAAIITGVSAWIGGLVIRDDRREYRR